MWFENFIWEKKKNHILFKISSTQFLPTAMLIQNLWYILAVNMQELSVLYGLLLSFQSNNTWLWCKCAYLCHYSVACRCPYSCFAFLLECGPHRSGIKKFLSLGSCSTTDSVIHGNDSLFFSLFCPIQKKNKKACRAHKGF